MSAPNQELADALHNAISSFEYKVYWEEQMKRLQLNIAQDSYSNRGTNYSRRGATVAAMLAEDGVLRGAAKEQGIDLREFDNIVGQAAQLMLTKVTKTNPAVKVVKVLREISGI